MRSASFASLLGIIACLLFTQISYTIFHQASLHALLCGDRVASLMLFTRTEFILNYGVAIAVTYFDEFSSCIVTSKKPITFNLSPMMRLSYAHDHKELFLQKASDGCASSARLIIAMPDEKNQTVPSLVIEAHGRLNGNNLGLSCLVTKVRNHEKIVYRVMGYRYSTAL